MLVDCAFSWQRLIKPFDPKIYLRLHGRFIRSKVT
ncbi:MAG: hypothetical protein RLZ00_1578 [Pseudomonadota bacterium]